MHHGMLLLIGIGFHACLKAPTRLYWSVISFNIVVLDLSSSKLNLSSIPIHSSCVFLGEGLIF